MVSVPLQMSDTVAATGRDQATRIAQICAAWASSGEFGDHVVYERDGRWTFAARPRARVVLTKGEVTLEEPETGDRPRTYGWTDDPAAALAAAVADLELPGWQLYGWVGFDFCAPYHGLSDHVPADVVLAHFIVPQVQAHLTIGPDGVHLDVEGGDPELTARFTELAAHAHAPGPARPLAVDDDPDDYRGRVGTAVAEIRRGDYQKVIMSRRVEVPFGIDMPQTYARGRAGNNPARSYLLRLGDLSAAGFSPELVVAASADGEVLTEPLAGTRALGVSAGADAAARAELLADEKEIAEHAMSVRACFDEIASVSLPGTTAVSEFMQVRDRGSVQHLASTVRGELAPTAGPWRALAVLFPSITASGIPKAPAVEAIYRLEPDRRELYSGAVLVASADGALEATLALRSVFTADGRSWLRAGAGVVGQSTPEREFTETCEKLGSVAPFVVPARADGSAAGGAQ